VVGLFSKATVLIYSALQSKVKQHLTTKKAYWFLKKDVCKRSPDAFFEFAKCNPALAENSGLQ
jgi:hypothetical protein